jgi:hypothetical protein
MSAYTAVLGALLLIPWALFALSLIGTALSSSAASKRRARPEVLPAPAAKGGRIGQGRSFPT